MGIGDITAAIFHQLVWYLLLYLNMPLPFSRSLSFSSGLKTTIPQRATNNHIVVFLLHADGFHLIPSIKSQWQELLGRNELPQRINTSSLWRPTFSTKTILWLFSLRCSFSYFFTVWQESYHRCQPAFHDSFHPRQMHFVRCFLMPWKSGSIVREMVKRYLVLCFCVTWRVVRLSNIWLYKLIILSRIKQSHIGCFQSVW